MVKSVLATNILLLTNTILRVIGLLTVLYAAPVYLSIVHETNIEMAREYRAAEEIHAQQWQYMLDKFFVLRCNTDQADSGDK